jgi:hypothetical protein
LLPSHGALGPTQNAKDDLIRILWSLCGVTVNDYGRIVAFQLPFLVDATLIRLGWTTFSQSNLYKQNVSITLTCLEMQGKRTAIPNHFNVDEFTHSEQHVLPIQRHFQESVRRAIVVTLLPYCTLR